MLQIDSHSDQMGELLSLALSFCFLISNSSDNSSSRIYDLSAPLAAAGISILYQSSYTSDFIFVRLLIIHRALSMLTVTP